MDKIITLEELYKLAHLVELKPSARKPHNEKLMIDYYDIVAYLNGEENE